VLDSPYKVTNQFSGSYRLKREIGFSHVIGTDSVGDRTFKLFFHRNSLESARLGIVASKKIIPRSTDRNRIKRIIRDAFRRHNIKQYNFDLVVMVKRDYVQQLDKLNENLQKLFSQLENKCAK
jgi:ribonuclease P protein component